MKKEKGSSFILIVIAVIIGSALFKQFDFKTLRFEKIGLSIVYLLTLIVLIIIIVRNNKNRPKIKV